MDFKYQARIDVEVEHPSINMEEDDNQYKTYKIDQMSFRNPVSEGQRVHFMDLEQNTLFYGVVNSVRHEFYRIMGDDFNADEEINETMSSIVINGTADPKDIKKLEEMIAELR